MLPHDLDRLTPIQRTIVEQAFVLAKELETAADTAPEDFVGWAPPTGPSQ